MIIKFPTIYQQSTFLKKKYKDPLFMVIFSPIDKQLGLKIANSGSLFLKKSMFLKNVSPENKCFPPLKEVLQQTYGKKNVSKCNQV